MPGKDNAITLRQAFDTLRGPPVTSLRHAFNPLRGAPLSSPFRELRELSANLETTLASPAGRTRQQNPAH
jgi:hypothetical protein